MAAIYEGRLSQYIWPMNWVAFSSFIIAVATAVFLYLQTRALTKSVQVQLYQHLMTSQGEVEKLLMVYPEVQTCIFGDNDLPSSNTEIGQRTRLVIDLYLQVIEALIEHFRIVPKSARSLWLQRAIGLTKRPSVVQFDHEYPGWHPVVDSGELERLLAQIKV